MPSENVIGVRKLYIRGTNSSRHKRADEISYAKRYVLFAEFSINQITIQC